jgi:hypothetical protein
MTNDIKMKNYFLLPMPANYVFPPDAKRVKEWADQESCKEAVALAINSYDGHIERIKELEKAITKCLGVFVETAEHFPKTAEGMIYAGEHIALVLNHNSVKGE